MSSATPIHHGQRSPNSSASVHSTVNNPTSGNTSESPDTGKTNRSQASNVTSFDIQYFATNQMDAQSAKAQQTTSSGTPTYIASSSDTNTTHFAELPGKIKLAAPGSGSHATYSTNSDQPTLSNISVPTRARVVQVLKDLKLPTITFSIRRKLGTELGSFCYFSTAGEFSLPEGLSPSVKQMSLMVDPLLKDSLNTPPKNKTGVEWPLRGVSAAMANGVNTSFRALVLGRLVLKDEDNIRNHTYWVVVMATDYRSRLGNNLFALRASKIAKSEMLDEEDFELYEENNRCKYSALENLFGPAKDGLMYYLGPLSLLGSDFNKNGETSGVSGGSQVDGHVSKAESLHISSWTSEDIVLNPNDLE